MQSCCPWRRIPEFCSSVGLVLYSNKLALPPSRFQASTCIRVWQLCNQERESPSPTESSRCSFRQPASTVLVGKWDTLLLPQPTLTAILYSQLSISPHAIDLLIILPSSRGYLVDRSFLTPVPAFLGRYQSSIHIPCA